MRQRMCFLLKDCGLDKEPEDWSREYCVGGGPCGPRTAAISSLSQQPNIALTLALRMRRALGGTRSKINWRCSMKASCGMSWHGWYTEAKRMLSDFPFTHRPLLSWRLNLRLRPRNQPANSLVGSIVIGGGDPASLHVRWNLGERTIATPRNRCLRPVNLTGEFLASIPKDT